MRTSSRWSVGIVAALVCIAACGDDDGADGSRDAGGSGGQAGVGGTGGVGGIAGAGGSAGATESDAGNELDAGNDAGLDASGDSGGAGGDDGGGGSGGSGTCGVGNGYRVIPTVQLLIDGSGSMTNAFGAGTRWSALHDALLGTEGVVRTLESTVRFGMSIYQTGTMTTCPVLTGPAPALNNYGAISGAWLSSPSGATPTGEAMDAVVATMAGGTIDAPQLIILATDGAPNGCGGSFDWAMVIMCLNNPSAPECAQAEADGYMRTLEATYAAQAKSIDVYVIDLSDGGANQQELQKVANVGVGLPADQTPGATLFTPTDPVMLTAVLDDIVTGATPCVITLQGQIGNVANVCNTQSVVTLNSQPLTCGGSHGWRAIDTSHIELVGNACAAWRNNSAAQVHVQIACDSVNPG